MDMSKVFFLRGELAPRIAAAIRTRTPPLDAYSRQVLVEAAEAIENQRRPPRLLTHGHNVAGAANAPWDIADRLARLGDGQGLPLAVLSYAVRDAVHWTRPYDMALENWARGRFSELGFDYNPNQGGW